MKPEHVIPNILLWSGIGFGVYGIWWSLHPMKCFATSGILLFLGIITVVAE